MEVVEVVKFSTGHGISTNFFNLIFLFYFILFDD